MPSTESPSHGLMRRVALLALLLTVSGCNAGERAVEDGARRAAIVAQLDSAYATFSRAYAEADVRLLMDEVYAEDGFYLPPGSPILEGQDQFRGQFSWLERYALDDGQGPTITFEIVDRTIDTELATDIGIYTVRVPGQPVDDADRGKFIVIWKRNDRGEWRIWADGFSGME